MTTLTSTPAHSSQTAILRRIRLWLLSLALALLLTAGLAAILTPVPARAAGPLCYVDADATGGDGSSWTDAYTTVQDALAVATCTEIWVAKGVYYPDEGAGQTNNAITSTFALANSVALYGGFNGTETSRDQRDPTANITVLSGDIDQNDITDPNGVVTDTANITGTNAYHVVTGSGTDDTAVLNGFTVTAGQVNPSGYGGGMYNSWGSPALTGITFSGNSAGYGGGMYNGNNSSPALTNVTFSGNSAYHGGGMFNYIWSNPALTNVTFSNNSANGGYGGGMYNQENSSPALTNVTFSGNSAYHGGGMFNYMWSSPTLRNVTFSGNYASQDYGGGMYNRSNSNPTLTNVTFSGNSAYHGGGMYNDTSSPTLTNTIIANSTLGGDCVNGSNGGVAAGSANNLIEDSAHACGLTNGTNGNIIGVDPNLGALTDFGSPGKQVFPLLFGSPAIDAGTNTNCPTTDQRGATRPVGTVCDIGAYELDTFTLTIAKSVDNPTPLPGQTVTFTVVVTNIGPLVTNGLLSDTLPAELNFLGPITLEPTGAGSVGTAPPTVASGLTISNSQRITVTFPVTVSYGIAAGTLLTNTASVSADQVPMPTRASTVVTVGNAPPTADAGASQTVNPGGGVTLDGSASSDPNGDSLTFGWRQTGGVTVTLFGATTVSPTFTAPVTTGTVLTFSLTVTDTGGLTDVASTTVTVEEYRIYLPLVLKQ